MNTGSVADSVQLSREVSHIVLLLHQVRQDNEDEIFQILMSISPEIGHLLAALAESTESWKNETESNSEVLECVKDLAATLVNKFVGKLKEIFSGPSIFEKGGGVLNFESEMHSSTIQSISSCMEQLQVLIGNTNAEEKLKVVVSRCMDMLLQHHLTCLPDAENNLEQCTNEFISLSRDVRVLMKTIFSVLMCSSVDVDYDQQVLFVQDAILEKLSIELLTLAESIMKVLKRFQGKAKDPVENELQSASSSNFGSENKVQLVEVITNLSRIVDVYLTIEEDIKSSEQLGISNYCTKMRHKKGVLKRNFDLPDLIQSSQHNRTHTSEKVTPKWEWVEMLRELSPSLTVLLTDVFKETHKKLLQDTKEAYSSKDDYMPILIPSTSLLKLKSRPSPKLSLQYVGKMLDLVLAWLPLMIVGGRKPCLHTLQSESVDVVNQTFKEIRNFFITKMDETVEKFPIDALIPLLSSAQDVVLILQDCSRKLESSRSHFHSTVLLYEGLQDHIMQLIIQYHKSKLATTLLHDADSHYWSDPRAYYEGERSSVAITMWKAHLNNLNSNLQNHVSNECAIYILLEVMCDSLTVLTNRYCMCKTSFNRNFQLQLDIPAILSCAFELLWTATPVTFCLLKGKTTSQTDLLMKIFASCADLFLCLNLSASPLQPLAMEVASIIQNVNSIEAPFFHWLTAFNPFLFPVGWRGELHKLPPTSLTLSLLIFLCSDTYLKHEYILECLSNSNFYLVHLLASGELSCPSMQLADLQTCLINFLSNNPTCISKLLWTCATSDLNFSISNFLDLEYLKKSQNYPWQSFISQSILPHVRQAVLNCVQFVSSNTWSPVAKHIINSLPGHLKSLVPDFEGKNKKMVLYSCVASVLQGLRMCAMNLDHGISLFLVEVDRALYNSNLNANLIFNCYGTHLLLYCAQTILQSPELLAIKLGMDIKHEALDLLHEVGDALLNISELEVASKNYPGLAVPLSEEITAFGHKLAGIFSHDNEVELCLETMDVNEIYQDKEKMDILSHLHKLLCTDYHVISQQLLGGESPKQASPFVGIELNVTNMWPLSLPSSLQYNSWEKISYLLKQRPDMQENAYLNEEERNLVQLIKEHFRL